MNNPVTLPREVVRRAMDALYYTATKKSKHPNQWMEEDAAIKELRAALEQPQNHVPDVGNMVQAGWKLVPVEPTIRQMAAMGPAIRACYDMDGVSGNVVDVYRAMLAAAPPQPQVEQEQEQEPVAWIENVEGGIGYNPYHEAARKLPDGVRFDLYVHPQNLRCKSNQARLAALWGYVKAEQLQGEQAPVGFVRQIDIDHIAKTPSDWGAMFGSRMGFNTVPLYTHPQPKRKPLTGERIAAIYRSVWTAHDEADEVMAFARAIEAAHDIKDES